MISILFFFFFTLTKYLIDLTETHLVTVIYTYVTQSIQKFRTTVAVQSNQFRISPRKSLGEKSL